jgi:hypothetical protein
MDETTPTWFWVWTLHEMEEGTEPWKLAASGVHKRDPVQWIKDQVKLNFDDKTVTRVHLIQATCDHQGLNIHNSFWRWIASGPEKYEP